MKWDYPEKYAFHARKVQEALKTLFRGDDRFTPLQLEILMNVAVLKIVPSTGRFQGKACPQARTVEITDSSIEKHQTGGLIWLFCHEAYHVWDKQRAKKEGNANLFANKIKHALERKPAIYSWNEK